MKEHDIAWAAGVFDAEGSLTIGFRRKHVKKYVTLARYYKMSLLTTDPIIVPEFSKIFNIPYKYTRKNFPYCTLSSTNIKIVLPILLPYLLIKRKQAEIILEAINIKHDCHQYTTEETAQWNNLYSQIKYYNAVGANNCTTTIINEHKFHMAWLAGLIDGDGSLSINKFTRQTKPVLKLSLTNHTTIDYISQKLNIPNCTDKIRGNRAITKTIRILPNKLRELLPQIIPYLRLKQQQAQLCMQLLQLKRMAINKKSGEMKYLESLMKMSNNIAYNKIVNINNTTFYVNNIDNPNDLTTDIMFYSDEWKMKKDLLQQLILHKAKLIQPIYKLRPQQCTIQIIDNKTTKPFYEQYHYQGTVNATYNIGAYFNTELIACMSIKKPTRQCSGDWEIARMTRNYNFQIHGIWSYLMAWIINNKLIHGQIISFSDNRLMLGDVYKYMGFKHISNVKKDYYWVKDSIRYHKSSLRKTKQEKLSGLTETQLRTAQHYHRIWDRGKKKWALII